MMDELDLAPDFGVIDDPDFIYRHLHSALLADADVEVELNDDPISYACFFVGKPRGADSPDPDGDDALPENFLRLRRYLLISPLDPVLGNERVRQAEKVRLYFPDRLSGLSADLSYLGDVNFSGFSAIMLSYPERLLKLKRRYISRVRVPDHLQVMIGITPCQVGPDTQPFTALLRDIHPRGVAFQYPSCHPLLPEGLEVQVTITDARLTEPLTLTGRIRHHAARRGGGEEESSADPVRCGIQFEYIPPGAVTQQQLALLTEWMDQAGKERHQTARLANRRLLAATGDRRPRRQLIKPKDPASE